MELLVRFANEVNYVMGRMLQEYNAFDREGEKEWSKVSQSLTDFVQDIKTDERIPEIHGASNVSALHKSYLTGKNKLFMHEVNMHLLTMFTADEYTQVEKALGRAYYRAMRCNSVESKSPISEVDAIGIFFNNPWLITLYVIRLNYFTPIVSISEGRPDET